MAKQIEQHFMDSEKNNMEAIFTISGFNFAGAGQNAGLAFVALKDWSDRPGAGNRADTIATRATQTLGSIRDARVISLNPPAISGLGQTGGFEFQLQADAGTTRSDLKAQRNTLLGAASSDKGLAGVRPGGVEDMPQLKVHIDDGKALSLGLSLPDINSTLNAALAGSYVNDFIDRSRVKRVYMQGDAEYRSRPEDIGQWRVRGDEGTMAPFSAFSNTEWQFGPESLTRYNGLSSYLLQGQSAIGGSSGAAMDRMEALAKDLPPGSVYSWTGLSYQEQLSRGQTLQLYAFSILVVFLCLAALYESWSVPFSVMLVIPLGILGAVMAAMLRGLENDVYFQVALLTTVGLSAKNAILIVEFAEAAYNRGLSLTEAAMEAARLRLRPILMTSLAFIAGVMPLALSTGAGANSRVSIGSGIVGGTLTATVLAIFFVPLFFVLVRKIFSRADYRPTGKTAVEGT